MQAVALKGTAVVPGFLASVFKMEAGGEGRSIPNSARSAIVARRGQKKWASGGADNTTGALFHGALTRTMAYSKSYQNPANRASCSGLRAIFPYFGKGFPVSHAFSRAKSPSSLPPALRSSAGGHPCPGTTRGLSSSWSGRFMGDRLLLARALQRALLHKVLEMNRLLLLLILLAWLEPGLADPPLATARLVPPLGGPGITANLTFIDNGRSLRVFGSGRGFAVGKHYHTLIYEALPSGPQACIPSPNPPFPFSTDQMQIGAWQPIGRSTRVLAGLRSGDAYLPLSVIGVVSVRRHDQIGATVQLVRESCGDVVPR